MTDPEIIKRENWGVPDTPTEHRECHHCDPGRGFERACGCVVCSKCAAECWDCGGSFCVEHTYECDGDDGEKVRICHGCQSHRNYFAVEKEIAEKRRAAG